MRMRHFGRVRPLLWVCWLGAGLGLLMAGGFARAAIPEPDAVLWGEITTPAGFPLPEGQVVEVVHQATGAVLASYEIDFSSEAGYSSVFQVPMVDLSDGDSLPTGKAEVDDWVSLRVQGQPAFLDRQLNERGYIEHFEYTDLVLTDSDSDLIPDIYETGTGVYQSLVDTGSDPGAFDSDGDGWGDGAEALAGTDPNDAQEFPLPAGSGDVNEDGKVDLADALLLERVLRGETLSYDFDAADIAPMGDPDGEITVADLLILIRVIRGEILVVQ